MLPELITQIPGPRSRELAGRLRKHESRNVTYVVPGFPVFWERAEGANVWDVDGNRYLDLTSAFGVATAGFGAPHVKEAFRAQSAVLEHGMGDVHPSAAKAALCEGLSRVTFERWGKGPGKVILGSSGFEAVEAALKTVYLATGKPRVVAFEGAYHGLGLGALAATGWEMFQGPFRRQLPEVADFVPYPRKPEDLEKVAGGIRRIVARGESGAVLVEPIQGRGGEVVPPDGFLEMLRTLCDELGILLVFDEIYTGFFRTGKWFACEHEGVTPDLICLGKALSGAYPISACVGSAKVMDAWPESMGEALHTSTFLGNPVGCALALASLKHWQGEKWEERIRLLESQWKTVLEPLAGCGGIREVRGRGLLWGVEWEQEGIAGSLMAKGLQKGMLLLGGAPDGRVLSLAPSVCVGGDEIAWVGVGLRELAAEIQG